MSSLFAFIGRILGTFSWSPPSWISSLADCITSVVLLTTISILKLLAEKPLRFINYSLLTLALIISSYCGYIWFSNLPAPKSVNYTFSELYPLPASDPNAKPQAFNLQFDAPAASLKLTGKKITNGVLLEPAIKGEWKWIGDRNLVFEPNAEWPVGQKFSVRLDQQLFTSDIRVENKDFSFYSPKFKILSHSAELYQDPLDPKIRQAVLKLKLSHPADKADLERKTNIRIKRKSQKEFSNSTDSKLGFKLAFDDIKREAFIRSDLIDIPESDSEVQIIVASGLKAAAGGEGTENEISANVSMPGVENYFKISAVTEDIITNQDNHQAERIINISSTASIKQSQLIKNTEVLLLPDDPELYKLSNPEESEQPDYEQQDEYAEETDEYSDPDSCPWTNPAQVPAQAIKKASKVLISWLDSPQDPGSDNAFKINTDPGRCLLISVKKGTNSFAGIPLAKDISFVVKTREFPKEILFTDKGAILALNGERKINVLSRGIQAIQFKLYRVLPNSLHHLSQFGFNYPYAYNTPSFDYNFGPENISEVYNSKSEVVDYQPGETAYNLFDFGKYLDAYPQSQRGLFILKAYGLDQKTNNQIGEAVNRLVLVSNLGFLTKQNQDLSSSVFVMSTATQQPVEAAKVEVLGKNGLSIATVTTDATGQANIPDLSNFKNEKTPVTYVVSSGNDQSFMPYSLGDRWLNFSRFDTGGLYSVENEKSLQAFLFSDRGIYRPGETAKIGLIVKKLDWGLLPKDLPLEISIKDPRDIEVSRQKLTFDPEGFKEFSYDLSSNALTGGYSIGLEIIGKNKQRTNLGQTNIRVEEFLPDRLRIDAKWSDNGQQVLKTNGWYKPENLKADITLKNLYGNPAEGHKLKAQIKLRPNSLTFKEFSAYHFYDPFNPYRQNSTFDEDLGDITSDSDGAGTFDLALSRFDSSTYGLTAIIQGFEKDGGRSVATTLSAMVSPADYIIGWKADSDLNFIKKNFNPVIDIIALNSNAAKTEVNNLKLELYESKYLSILTRQNSGNLAYQSVLKENLLASSEFSIAKEGYQLTLQPEKAGNYFYKVKSSDGKELNTIRFKVVGDADLSGNLEKNAELDVKLDRSDYPSESEIQVSITAPYKGSGLITIERDKVYASKWFNADSSSSLQTISIPKGLEGNAYINIALVRSLDSKDIFASPLSYAAIPFSISKESRNQRLLINAPESMRPGQDLIISASSAERTKAIIYAVDEGILQVARYRKPEPVSHFFRKRALEVGTKQILDLLLPEYSLTKEFSAAGGDEDALLGKHRNPFKRKGQKPVIFWSGITELDSTVKHFSFPVPDYFSGSIKSFIVAVSDNRIGSAENSTQVKSDLVLQPNAPLFAAPNDEFVASVTVANTTTADKFIKVSLQSDKSLELISPISQDITIPAGKDKLIEFSVKALNQLGSANLVFMAESEGTAKSSYTIDLSVRPSAPKLDSSKIGSLGTTILSSDSAEIPLERRLFEQYSERKFSFSALPQGLSYSLAKFLEYFPHGCSEQISSQGLSLLMLENTGLLDISQDKQKKTLNNIFLTLANRQQENGSFSLWPGSSYSPDWSSLHSARLIIESKLAGIEVNSYLLSNTERYLKDYVAESINNETNILEEARLKAYAIYMLTRLGNISTNNLKSLSEQLAETKDWQKDITALFMAASYSQLLLEKQASELLKSFDFSALEKPRTASQLVLFSSLSQSGLALDIISRHFPKSTIFSHFNSGYFEKLGKKLSDEMFNTLEASNIILGLSSYTQSAAQPDSSSIRLESSKDNKIFNEISVPAGKMPVIKIDNDTKKLKIHRLNQQTVFYQLFESGFDLPESKIPQNSGLEIYREFLNSSGEVTESFNLGEDITVLIKVRNKTSASILNDISIIDVHPSGLEVTDGTSGMASNFNDNWNSKYLDSTEDRCLFFGDLLQGAAEIKYKIKAVAKGKFALPALQAEAMYDPRIFARTQAAYIEIK